MLLHTGYLLTNDRPLIGLGCAGGLCVGKMVPVNTALSPRISKGHKRYQKKQNVGFLKGRIPCDLVLKPA